MLQPSLLALDWGMSNLRSYLLAADGIVIDSRTAPLGVKVVQAGQFRETLFAHCGDWLEQNPELRVIAAGMIASRQGWKEAPYVSTPALPRNLALMADRADHLIDHPFALLPGVSHTPLGSPPDIMRGEAVQLLGALSDLGIEDGVFVLPGAHCKWIKVKDGAIDAFQTYMTGELYEVLSRHSILGRLFPAEPVASLTGFTQGLANAQFQYNNLAHMLFSTRTLGLFGQVAAADLPGYLSGILIGDEITNGMRWAGTGNVTLIGSSSMTRLYRHALAGFGHHPKLAPVDVAARGLHLLAQEINW